MSSIFIPSFILGIIVLITEYCPDFLTIKVPALLSEGFLDSGQKTFMLIEDNVLDEILSILIVISGLMVGFSKEKLEDEYIAKIRLESLVWAVYVNYGILILCFLFIYGLPFVNVMIYNLFTLLFFFIIRFNWKIAKLKKTMSYEE